MLADCEVSAESGALYCVAIAGYLVTISIHQRANNGEEWTDTGFSILDISVVSFHMSNQRVAIY